MSDLENFSRNPLLRVLSRLNFSNFIGGDSKVVDKVFRSFLHDLDCLFRMIFLSVSTLLLFPCIQSSDRSSGSTSFGILILTKVSDFLGGFQSYRKE